jgi:hypothetical protein
LWDRRRQVEEQRDALIEAAKERGQRMLQRDEWRTPAIILRAWVTPQFFVEDAIPLSVATDYIAGHYVASDLMNQMRSFPGDVYYRRSVPMGYCAYYPEDQPTSVVEYDELSTSGLVYTELRWNRQDADTDPNLFEIIRILSHIDGLIKFSDEAFGQYLAGLLQVHVSLHNVEGVVLYGAIPVYDMARGKQHISPNSDIIVLHQTIDRFKLATERRLLVKLTAKQIMWAFGYGWDEELFERKFNQWYPNVAQP